MWLFPPPRSSVFFSSRFVADSESLGFLSGSPQPLSSKAFFQRRIFGLTPPFFARLTGVRIHLFPPPPFFFRGILEFFLIFFWFEGKTPILREFYIFFPPPSDVIFFLPRWLGPFTTPFFFASAGSALFFLLPLLKKELSPLPPFFPGVSSPPQPFFFFFPGGCLDKPYILFFFPLYRANWPLSPLFAFPPPVLRLSLFFFFPFPPFDFL